MRIQLETGGNAMLIQTYGPSQIVINQDRYNMSLIVQPERVLPDWPPQTVDELALPHIQMLADLGPEVVLIGTGQRLHFPRAELLAPLVVAGIGWEIMDTGAACRTYNILMGEGRKVTAALMMIENGSPVSG
jgi:uncharacterized protein